jgi:hypothetical protein
MRIIKAILLASVMAASSIPVAEAQWVQPFQWNSGGWGASPGWGHPQWGNGGWGGGYRIHCSEIPNPWERQRCRERRGW